jgi:hypothetical protein
LKAKTFERIFLERIAVEDGERARAVGGILVAEDGREVLVGELDHFGHLREADGAALGVERVVVAPSRFSRRPASW